MPSKGNRSKGAGSGVAMSAGAANQDLQTVKFGSSESEAQVRGLLSKADTMRVRVRLADEQDVEGHLFGGGDSSLVLALQLSDDDDVEGHAISIHFPDAEQARRFRNELLAAGVLTATLAMGVGTGIALAPHQTGTAAAPASQATVFMDTSAQAREGGALTQSRTLAIPVGGASDAAQKARDAAIAAQAPTDTAARESGAVSGVTGPELKTQIGSQSKGSVNVNPAAAADTARTQAGITGSLAGSTTGSDASTKAREGTSVNPMAAADAARTQAGISGSLAGSSSASDTSTKAREGGALSESTANPAAAADAARTQAGVTGSLAGSASVTPSSDTQTQAREGGAVSQSSSTTSPKVDYSGKPLPDEPTSSSPAQSSPNVDYSGKPLPPVDKA
jgi:hypothetical protein